MKKSKFVFLSSAIMAATLTFSSCGGGSDEPGGGGTPVFNFVPLFDSGRDEKLFKGEDELITIAEYNTGNLARDYEYELIDGILGNEVKLAEDYVKVTKQVDAETGAQEFKVELTAPTSETVLDPDSGKEKVETFEVGIRIKEVNTGKRKPLYFTIDQRYDKANTGYNFSADTEEKEEILGKLEEYAMKNYLTGITLFENGGYVRYSPRVHLGAKNNKYVTGYGFGLLTDGYLDDEWTPDIEASTEHKKYLQSASSSDPGNISGWNAEGSQVSDLYSYITSSFWGTRLTASKDAYEWYPVLAKDDCPDPIPNDGDTTTKIHKKYKVYVKTGNISYSYIPEANADGSAKAGAKYHNRPVTIDDYLTTFQVLLTQSCDLFRGSEFASDTSYGLKGAYSYFRKTKGATWEQAETHWNDMQSKNKLGIKKGNDAGGDYLEFEFLNPIDTFTAKYTLSSNLYSPLPKEFLNEIGGTGKWVKGAYNFGTGTKDSSHPYEDGSILKNTLCLGPYYLEEWSGDIETYFKRDNTWPEYVNTQGTTRPRYRIPGVHIRVVSAAKDDDTAIYQEFGLDHLDQTGIPVTNFQKYKKASDLKVEGDSTFKLNVNSLDQATWDEMFLKSSTNPKYKNVNKADTRYLVNKWMSNKHFLNGLFWSINREEFAKDRGVNASTDYFSNAYLSDPINGVSYNKTKAHYDAQDAFDPYLADKVGYDAAKANSEFNLAVSELVKNGDISLGTKSRPTELDIRIEWMYQNDETTYGEDIANYFTDAFKGVGEGLVKLVVKHHAGADWQQVYNDHLQCGCFDLGFGAISGNTLAPLNFLEVLKSDNSSGFTLNWGTDTSVVDKDDPIVYEVSEKDPNDPSQTIKVKKEWSFDALWAAADHGSIVQNGESVDSVYYGYTTSPTSGGVGVNRLANGGIMECPFEFVRIDEGATFEITRIDISLVGYGALTIDLKDTQDKLKKWVTIQKSIVEGREAVTGIVINFDNTEVYETEDGKDYTFAQYINYLMFVGMKNQSKIDNLDPVDDKDEIEDLKNPFSYNFYGEDGAASKQYWFLEVWFDITIEGSVPTENSYSIKVDRKSALPSEKFSLAK